MRFRRAAMAALALSVSAAPEARGAVRDRYLMDRWNTDNGLPQAAVNAMLQSRDGYLWLATFGGVARFDGTAFTSVTTGDRTGLLSDRVTALAEDREGRIWIGTENGLSRYDAGRLTTLTTRQGLPGNDIRSLAAHPDGSVWMGTPEGALARVASSGEVRVIVEARGVLGTPIQKILVDDTGVVWVGAGSGVWRLDPSTNAPVMVRRREKAQSPLGIMSLAPDGTFWTLTESGLLRVGPSSEEEFSIEFPGLQVARVHSIAVDREETVWLGGDHGEVWRFRTADREVESVQEVGLGWNTALLIDREGSVWIGNRISGLARLRPSHFQVFTTGDGLAQDNATGIFEDSKGRVWAGGNCGGVAVREREGKPFEKLSASQAPRCVWSIAEDGVGDIWFAGSGIGRLRKGKGENFLGKEGWPKTGARALFLDRNGLLWMGGREGLAHWDGAALQWVRPPPPLNLRGVQAIHESRDGALWIATIAGLFRYSNGEFQSFTTAQGLPHDDVRFIHEDADGVLWIATYGGGLARKTGGQFRSFSTADGLIDNFISSVADDGAGFLWLSTNRGVMRIARRDLETRGADATKRLAGLSYGRADGMLSSETNGGFQGAFAKIGGRFFYPTLVGIAAIDPKVAINSVPPSVTLERVSVNGQPRDPRSELAVGPGAVDLEFAYSGLSLNAPHAVTFRYRLQGWDTDWIDAGTRRSANYSQLPPARYQFSVLAANRDGIWSAATAPVTVRVLPQYWQTWWFRALALLGLAAVPLLRERGLRRRQTELEELISARTHELGEAVARLQVSEQQALSAKDAALQASQAKSTFLANMSHELRTPLNAVIGFSQVLERRDSFRGEDRESLRIIQRSGEHLLGLINDILSLSRIEAGGLTLQKTPFDLPATLDAVRAMTRVRAEAKGLEVVFDIDPTLPRKVLGDEGRLRQVLINLLGNAVKFTRVGKVTLRASYQDGRARFEVIDTGQGIAEDEIPKLFNAFVQTESGEKSREGTGLGLAISAQIVKLMGGEIKVRSRVFEGSVFTLEIPLETTDEAVAEGPDRRVRGLAPGQAGPRILVVDDTAENRILLAQVLGAAGFEVKEAVDGEQAIARVAEFQPALILMDARMKVMDGREATRRIRTLEAQKGPPRTVVIALSAGAFEHEREQMLAAGADDFVAKPFRIETIFAKLKEHLGVDFIYDDVAQGESRGEKDPTVLTSGRVAALPKERLRELHEALSAGHVRKAQAAAEKILAEDEALGRAFLVEISAFRLDSLLSILEQAGVTT